MKKLLIIFLTFSMVLLAQSQNCSVIPKPAHVELNEGTFTFSEDTKIIVNKKDVALTETTLLSSQLLESALNQDFPIIDPNFDHQKGNIHILRNSIPVKELGVEGYELKIERDNIYINANTENGVFYAFQTLWQIITSVDYLNIPCFHIKDYPRFQWRGLHLDVSRHFFPVEFIYKYIDYIAMHKLNVFHWHLIDDQGWRLEIKKYPKLTEIGAWRANKEDLPWNNRPLIKRDDIADFGGFYTQEDVKNIVEYARQRHITVVPEIEMPAHVMSALAAYPDLSCTGQNLGVPSGGVWPITHIYCAGNDDVFIFLENVLNEVFTLFPSTYIHIGGDEAFKDEWKNCEKCQERMNTEDLDDVEELQSYFIKRIEKFVNKNGRKIIGWDEILEGGLAPEAAVMSWRGEKGGIEAAKDKHDVVMTPGSHCYFDHYQGLAQLEPHAIGGYTPLKKVYEYDPIPKKLSSKYKKHILGAQANVWTEYMPKNKHVEYMVFPRISALSEVLWSRDDSKDWSDFITRMEDQYDRYDKKGINYSNSVYQVRIKPKFNQRKKVIEVALDTDIPNADIRYTTNGDMPHHNSINYKKPFTLEESAQIKAIVLKNGQPIIEPTEKKVIFHDGLNKKISFKYNPSKHYRGNGNLTVIDGIYGSIDHHDGQWLGFSSNDMVAKIDLEQETKIDSITVNALQSINAYIFYPTSIEIEGSKDGKIYNIIGRIDNNISNNIQNRTIHAFTIPVSDSTRHLKITAKNINKCPDSHYAKGKDAWLFIDEIVIQ